KLGSCNEFRVFPAPVARRSNQAALPTGARREHREIESPMASKPLIQFFGLLGPKVGWIIVSLVSGYILRRVFGYFSMRYVRGKSHFPAYYNLSRLFGWRSQFLFTMIALHITLRWMGYDPATLKAIDQWIEVGIIIGVWLFLARVVRIGR